MLGDEGNTPILYALSLEKLDIALALLEAGANPFIQNKFGISFAYMISMFHSDTIERKLNFIKKVQEKYSKEFFDDINRSIPNCRNTLANMLLSYVSKHSADELLYCIQTCINLGLRAHPSTKEEPFWEMALEFCPTKIVAIAKTAPEAFKGENIRDSEGFATPYQKALGKIPITRMNDTTRAQALQDIFHIFIENNIEPLIYPCKSTSNVIKRLQEILKTVATQTDDPSVVKLRLETACDLLEIINNTMLKMDTSDKNKKEFYDNHIKLGQELINQYRPPKSPRPK